MGIKEYLQSLTGDVSAPAGRPASEKERIAAEIERRLVDLNRCFVRVILPRVFETERDLHQMGFWNQLNIGQSTSLSDGKPNIKEVTLHFYPVRVRDLTDQRRAREMAYLAMFTPTGDFRKITFAMRFPDKLSPVAERLETTTEIGRIDTGRVDAFLERFIMGAVDAHASNRMFR